MRYTKRINDLVESLYRGPFERPRWNSFLELLKETCEADLSVIGLTHPKDKESYEKLIFWKTDKPLPSVADFVNNNDPDVFINLPDNEAVTLHQISSKWDLEQSRYYQDCLLENNWHYHLGIDLYRNNQISLFVRLTRGQESSDFSEKEKSLLNALSPHLKNLQRWIDRQEELSSERNIYESVVSHLALGAVSLNHEGNIVKMNPVAEHILNTEDGLYLDKGQLRCSTSALDTQLQEKILAANSNKEEVNSSLAIPRANASTPLYLTFKPSIHGEFRSDMRYSSSMVFINASEMNVTGSEHALQDMLGLTKTETKIAIALANGMTAEEIAEKMYVTANTVRSHIYRIYQKTDVNKQSLLVSMILRCLASLN